MGKKLARFKALYALKAANKKAKSRYRPHGHRMRASWFSELAKRKLVPRRSANLCCLAAEILKFKEFKGWGSKVLEISGLEF